MDVNSLLTPSAELEFSYTQLLNNDMPKGTPYAWLLSPTPAPTQHPVVIQSIEASVVPEACTEANIEAGLPLEAANDELLDVRVPTF